MSGIKTFSNETSERYALALFELVNEKSELDLTEKQILQLSRICKENEIFNSFLKNPTHHINEQTNIINQISRLMKFTKNLNNFLLLLVKKRRIFFLEKILIKFLKLSFKKKGKISASLTSSKELSKEDLNNINSEISKTIGSTIEVVYKVDKELISGVKLQVGSLLIDSSLSNKLKKYKQLMIEN